MSRTTTPLLLCISPAGVRGVDDRLGRALACLASRSRWCWRSPSGRFSSPGDWEWLPNLLGLSLGTLFTGLGLSSVVSARYNIAVPLPGDSPFKKPPGNVAQTLAVQVGGMGVLALLVIPELALVAVQAHAAVPKPDGSTWQWVLCWASSCSWWASGSAGNGWTRGVRRCSPSSA